MRHPVGSRVTPKPLLPPHTAPLVLPSTFFCFRPMLKATIPLCTNVSLRSSLVARLEIQMSLLWIKAIQFGSAGQSLGSIRMFGQLVSTKLGCKGCFCKKRPQERKTLENSPFELVNPSHEAQGIFAESVWDAVRVSESKLPYGLY